MSLPWLLQTENGDPRPGLGVVQASPDKMALSLPAQVSKQEFEERTQKARMLSKRGECPPYRASEVKTRRRGGYNKSKTGAPGSGYGAGDWAVSLRVSW